MSRMRFERWQSRFDGWVLVAAVGSVAGVAGQLAPDPWHTAGLALSWAAWSVFAAEAVVMPVLSPAPARWVRGHWLDLLIMLVACPVWPVLFYDLLIAELAPALTVLDAVKLAKLAKSVRIVRTRLGGRAVVTAMLVAATAVAVEVVRH